MPVHAHNPLVPPSEYTITASDATHLIFVCHVDKKLWTKSLVSVSCMLFLPFIIVLAFFIVFFSLMFGSMGAFFTIISIERFLVIVAVFIPVVFLFGKIMRNMLVRAVIIELDKFSNVFSMYTPGTLGGHRHGETIEHGTPGAGYPSRTSGHAKGTHHVSRSWDLEACTFRLVAPGEPLSRVLSTLRFTCRDRYLVVMHPAPGATPVPLLATVSVERASAMIDEMRRFKRGAVGIDSPKHDATRPATPAREPLPFTGDGITCTFCGARNSTSIRFCSGCGGELSN